MKKLIAIIFVAVFTAVLFADTETVNGVTYTYSISNGEAMIGTRRGGVAAIPTSTYGDIVIPTELGGCPVTSIGEFAFFDCSSLTSITIPNSVTEIGSGAFYNCSSLTSITIPESVTSIGSYAFAVCSSLTSITIPDSVTSIGSRAFSKCSSLKEFVVGENNPSFRSIYGLLCTKDGTEVLFGVNGEVIIPEGVTSIGSSAFYGCSSRTSITIPDSVTSIGEGAFCDCSSLKEFVVGENNPCYRSIDGILYSKDSRKLIAVPGVLESMTIPNGVTSIGESAFNGCSSLTSVTIPDSVTTIANYVFYGCSSLKSITIPNSVTEIGNRAFDGCGSLTSVYVEVGDATRVKELLRGKGVDVESLKFVEVDDVVMSIPQSWTESYPEFAAKFGTDFTKALTAKSGKTAAGGREMLVWEDYVAGTDPTDPNDKFTATMTMVDGKPVISWTPELDPERAAMRKYTTYGKVTLTDSEWIVVPEGRASDYNFFKVAVEMK